MKNNYYIQKDDISGQTVIFEFDKINGYKVLPKAKKEDEISVNKIVFVNPSFSEKIIKKKINLKIKYLLKKLDELGDDEGDEGNIRQTLMEAEKFKLMLINSYIKFLGKEYQGLSLKKLEIIIKELRKKLYFSKEKKNIIAYNMERYMRQISQNFGSDYEEYEEKKGRGR